MQNMKIMKERVLIAGGAGFLGSHLCDALISSGRSVACLDDLSTGSIENIRHLFLEPDFTFIEGDITHLPQMDCDMILNFACAASPVSYQKDPIRTLRVNFEGTRNLLELAKKNKAVFVQASTSEVYGDPEVHPQIESYRGSVNTTGPRSCYDEGKRVAEALCHAYAETAEVDVKIIRIFNTYGPRMGIQDGRAIPEFVVNALNGNPLLINGGGLQTRSFCYISDMIAGILAVLKAPSEFRGPVNIGNPSEISIASLAQNIIALTGSRSQIVFSRALADDPVRRRPDIGLAMSQLEWDGPVIRLGEGLQSTIEYFSKTFFFAMHTSVDQRPAGHAVDPAEQSLHTCVTTMAELDLNLNLNPHFHSGNSSVHVSFNNMDESAQ